MEIVNFPVLSSDGSHTLSGHVYLPDGFPDVRPRGVFHAVHGMAEHIGRYDALFRELCRAGWLACGYDHLGHGHTARDATELGFIAPRDGYDFLARDVGLFSDAVRKAYGMTARPYVLLGHSMGSFVVRYATAHGYVRPDGLVLMGTGGPNPATGAGLALIGLVKCFKGKRHVSPLLDNLLFGHYNDRFPPMSEATDACRWLNTQQEPVEIYCADPLCGYKFTASALGDLVRLTHAVNKSAWFRALPAGMPVLLVSGEDDPVGNYGKGVTEVRDRLAAAGVPVDCRLYPAARHEILFDLCAPQVVSDLSAFLGSIKKE